MLRRVRARAGASGAGVRGEGVSERGASGRGARIRIVLRRSFRKNAAAGAFLLVAFHVSRRIHFNRNRFASATALD